MICSVSLPYRFGPSVSVPVSAETGHSVVLPLLALRAVGAAEGVAASVDSGEETPARGAAGGAT